MARSRKTDSDKRTESAQLPESEQSEEFKSEMEDVGAALSVADDFKAETNAETGFDSKPAEGAATDGSEAEAIAESDPSIDPVEGGASEPETVTEQETPDEPRATAPAERPRRGGFVPVVLGGVIAAGLGFGAATYVMPDLLRPEAPSDELNALNERLSVQDGRISELLQDVAALKSELADKVTEGVVTERTDALDARIADLQGALGSIEARLGDQSGALDDVGARLVELEKRPAASGAASASALEAFGREMEAMREEIADQRATADEAQKAIENAAQAASEQMAAIADEAERLRQEAAETATSAAARAALSRLRSALDSGAALDPALADLKATGVEIQPALAEQSQGVPTEAALREAFAPAARDALSVSLKETVEGGAWDRLGAFVRSQTGARSLSPRAGDDPDAVLSRAEAALKAGDLALAVAEIEALPPDGQARMAEWVALAQRRMDAVEAVNEISRAME